MPSISAFRRRKAKPRLVRTLIRFLGRVLRALFVLGAALGPGMPPPPPPPPPPIEQEDEGGEGLEP